MVTRHFGPRAGKVVRHQVEQVEHLGRCAQVDVLEAVLACRQCRRQEIARLWKGSAQVTKETDVVMALLRRRRVFPVDFITRGRGQRVLARGYRQCRARWGSGKGDPTVYAVHAVPVDKVSRRRGKCCSGLGISRHSRKLGAATAPAERDQRLNLWVV